MENLKVSSSSHENSNIQDEVVDLTDTALLESPVVIVEDPDLRFQNDSKDRTAEACEDVKDETSTMHDTVLRIKPEPARLIDIYVGHQKVCFTVPYRLIAEYSGSICNSLIILKSDKVAFEDIDAMLFSQIVRSMYRLKVDFEEILKSPKKRQNESIITARLQLIIDFLRLEEHLKIRDRPNQDAITHFENIVVKQWSALTSQQINQIGEYEELSQLRKVVSLAMAKEYHGNKVYFRYNDTMEANHPFRRSVLLYESLITDLYYSNPFRHPNPSLTGFEKWLREISLRELFDEFKEFQNTSRFEENFYRAMERDRIKFSEDRTVA